MQFNLWKLSLQFGKLAPSLLQLVPKLVALSDLLCSGVCFDKTFDLISELSSLKTYSDPLIHMFRIPVVENDLRA